MERADNGLVLLFNHNNDQPIGRLEDLGIRDDGKFGGFIRFSRNALAQEVQRDVEDGILTDTSIGYRIDAWVESEDKGVTTYTATRFTPLEGSIVAVPADAGVGINRSADAAGDADRAAVPEVSKTRNAPEGKEDKMADKKDTAAPDGATASAGESREFERDLIADAGKHLKMEGVAIDAIRAGKTLSEFRDMVEDEAIKRAQEQTPAGHVDLSAKEVREYNPANAIRAIVEQKWAPGQGLEREVSEAAATAMGKESGPNRFFLPTNMMIRAAITGNIAGTASLGGNAVPTIQMPVIEILRNKSVLGQLGVTFMTGLTGDLSFPRAITANTSSWVGESPTAASALTALTLDAISMSPKTLDAHSSYSRQLAVQMSPDAQSFIINDLLAVIALALDSGGINGTGSSNQPTGVRATSGIGNRTLGAAGAELTFGHLVDFETDVHVANADGGRMGYVTNSTVRGKLKQTLKATSAGSAYIWEGDSLNGHKAVASQQLPSNLTQGTSTTICSSIVFGDWSQCLFGSWGGAIDILVDPYTSAKQNHVELHAYGMADVAVRHAAAFSKSDAVLT